LATVAELRDRVGSIGEKALLIGWIDPGAPDYSRPVARADFVFVGIDQRIERRGIHQPLFHQQRFERLDTQGEIRRNSLMFAIVRFVA
jgi:hypothetical protein